MPCAITRPWSITAIRSASSSASSRYWVVSRIVVPSRTSSRTIAQISLRLRGSSPVVGSSRNRIRGRVSRLDARSSRRRIPPEYVRAGRSAASASSKRSSSSAARRRASSRERSNRRPNISRFSRPVRISSTAANCPVSPSSSRTAAGLVHHVAPEDLGAPRVGREQRREHADERGLARLRSARAVRRPCPPRRRGRHPRAHASRRSAWSRPRRGRRPLRQTWTAEEGYGQSSGKAEDSGHRGATPRPCSNHSACGDADPRRPIRRASRRVRQGRPPHGRLGRGRRLGSAHRRHRCEHVWCETSALR